MKRSECVYEDPSVVLGSIDPSVGQMSDDSARLPDLLLFGKPDAFICLTEILPVRYNAVNRGLRIFESSARADKIVFSVVYGGALASDISGQASCYGHESRLHSDPQIAFAPIVCQSRSILGSLEGFFQRHRLFAHARRNLHGIERVDPKPVVEPVEPLNGSDFRIAGSAEVDNHGFELYFYVILNLFQNLPDIFIRFSSTLQTNNFLFKSFYCFFDFESLGAVPHNLQVGEI